MIHNMSSRMEKEMLKPADHFHGSDFEKIESTYGIRKEDIVSFSANVNPLGLSANLKQQLAQRLDVITSYPDREYKKLRAAIADYCGADPANILVGNGSTELISLMIQLKAPKKAVILGPAYSEYEREIALAGGRYTYFPLKEADDFVLDEKALISSLTKDTDLLILCNPNNPTASVITDKQMCRILDACQNDDIFVIVDETYVEFAPSYEHVTSIPLTRQYDSLVVLRGVSKFFASPGLRLGYAVSSNQALLQQAANSQNPWTVSSLADAAGQLLFADHEYIRQTQTLIAAERERMTACLNAIDGLKCYPSHANFILVRSLRPDISATKLFDAAIRKGLMIRDCSTFAFLDSSYFRFCFMNPEDNDRLIACISRMFAALLP